jgi:flagellar protein FliS
MSASAASYDAYKKVDIETASQGKLIVMLFNGAIQRAEEAKRQIEKRDLQAVHNNLIRSQDIIAELRGALNMNAGVIANNLDRLYEYFQHLLVQGNIRKDPAPIEECIRMMTSIRDAWQEVFEKVAKEEPPKGPPTINQHGAGFINVQG